MSDKLQFVASLELHTNVRDKLKFVGHFPGRSEHVSEKDPEYRGAIIRALRGR
ncbi:MAG TPA: hypothetical protein VK651_05475 [Blastocatellia bacterium]|nr:hypothetical protein [Blastocatellia bacterium]